jgi:hypothetical protein
MRVWGKSPSLSVVQNSKPFNQRVEGLSCCYLIRAMRKSFKQLKERGKDRQAARSTPPLSPPF